MSIELNHTVIKARNAEGSARFLTELLGLAPPIDIGGPFVFVPLANDMTLLYANADLTSLYAHPGIESQHLAFKVSDQEFATIYARIVERDVEHAADPFHIQKGQTHNDQGGRCVYVLDPNGHNLEIRTRSHDIPRING